LPGARRNSALRASISLPIPSSKPNRVTRAAACVWSPVSGLAAHASDLIVPASNKPSTRAVMQQRASKRNANMIRTSPLENRNFPGNRFWIQPIDRKNK